MESLEQVDTFEKLEKEASVGGEEAAQETEKRSEWEITREGGRQGTDAQSS